MAIDILQISDLHFGPHFYAPAASAVVAFAMSTPPSCIVVSGDLTQRAKRDQFRECGAFLGQLRAICPVVVIPGNHDIPLFRVFERLSRPYAHYEHYISREKHQSLRLDDVVICAINTTHPTRRITDPRLDPDELKYAGNVFTENGDCGFRILVTHQDPFNFPAKVPFATFAAWLETHRVSMILSGHSHVSFTTAMNLPGHTLLRTGCGTTTSTRWRLEEGQLNSMMRLRISASDLKIEKYFLSPGDPAFTKNAERHYQRSSAGVGSRL